MTYLTFAQLRTKLGGRARSSIYRDVEAGHLPTPKKLGGRLYWVEEDVDAQMCGGAQIKEMDLPTNPRKATDRRALHLKRTVEAEAMPVDILRALLREEIEAMLSDRALAISKIEEQSAREYFERPANVKGGNQR